MESMININHLFNAIEANNISGVEKCLKFNLNVNQAQDDTFPLLMAFSKSPTNIKIVELLLLNGADVNKQNSTGDTAIMFAVLEKNPDLLNLLVSYGANPHISNNWLETSLSFISKDNIDLIKHLIGLYSGEDLENFKTHKIALNTHNFKDEIHAHIDKLILKENLDKGLESKNTFRKSKI